MFKQKPEIARNYFAGITYTVWERILSSVFYEKEIDVELVESLKGSSKTVRMEIRLNKQPERESRELIKRLLNGHRKKYEISIIY